MGIFLKLSFTTPEKMQVQAVMVHPKALKKIKEKEKAKEQIMGYFAQASAAFPADQKKASLFIHKARRVAMKHRYRLPPELKRRFCKRCYAYLQPGVNARMRIHQGNKVVTCLDCNHIERIPFKK